MSIQFLCPVFSQIVFLLSYEFIIYLDINPLSDVRFVSIFSHSVGCLFVLLMVSFAVQNNVF